MHADLTSPPDALSLPFPSTAANMVVDLAGPTPKFVTSGGGDYGGIIEALLGLIDDKMIQVLPIA